MVTCLKYAIYQKWHHVYSQCWTRFSSLNGSLWKFSILHCHLWRLKLHTFFFLKKSRRYCLPVFDHVCASVSQVTNWFNDFEFTQFDLSIVLIANAVNYIITKPKGILFGSPWEESPFSLIYTSVADDKPVLHQIVQKSCCSPVDMYILEWSWLFPLTYYWHMTCFNKARTLMIGQCGYFYHL